MALDEHGDLIDPYGGQRDLEAKVLRHVSANFSEDPLRVLRTCRFAARYHHLGFTVAEKTMQLMRDIVRSGELSALAPDRVWRKTERALNENTPRTYFSLLRILGADKIVLPFMVTDNSLDALDSMASIAPNSLHRWAGLASSATANTQTVTPVINIPKRYDQLAARVQRYRGSPPQTPEDTLAFLEYFDAFRQGSQLTDGLAVLGAIDEAFHKTQVARIEKGDQLAASIRGEQFIEQGLKGPEIKAAISAERLRQLDALLDD